MTAHRARPASEKPYSVLAIDDSPEIIDTIRGALSGEFRVLAANDGAHGLLAASRQHPDLVLLDVVMPGTDGFDVCKQLKSDPATRDIPVIFVTALGAAGDELRGFALGAVDFVTKPIEPVILRTRVRTQAELGRMQKALRAANEQMNRERELIGEVILSMRHEEAFCAEGLAMASHSHDQTGGDLVLSARHPTGDRYILLGDFTGHGLPAAIGTPLVTHLFYDMAASGCTLNEILVDLNRVLAQRLPVDVFMAAAAVRVPAGSAEAEVWNFGSPDLLHRDRAGRWSHFSSRELPMGIVGTLPEFPATRLSLDEGEYLYLMSDGPIEAVTTDDVEYGAEGVKRTLDQTAQSVTSVFEDVLARAARFEALDDMTLLRIAGSKGE